MSKNILYIIGAVAFAAAFSQGFRGENIDAQIQKMTVELNAKCPQMVDEGTRLDSVTPRPPKSYCYNYTLVHLDKLPPNAEAIKNEIRKDLLKRVKEKQEMQGLFKKGITIGYLYNDKNGKEFLKIDIKPSDVGY